MWRGEHMDGEGFDSVPEEVKPEKWPGWFPQVFGRRRLPGGVDRQCTRYRMTCLIAKDRGLSEATGPVFGRLGRRDSCKALWIL
jgi:hypothetical protein